MGTPAKGKLTYNELKAKMQEAWNDPDPAKWDAIVATVSSIPRLAVAFDNIADELSSRYRMRESSDLWRKMA